MRSVGAGRVTLERATSQREALDHEPLADFTTQADDHARRLDPREHCVDHRVQRRSSRETPNGKRSRRSGAGRPRRCGTRLSPPWTAVNAGSRSDETFGEVSDEGFGEMTIGNAPVR